jgi:hypothetical protein
MLMLLMLLMLRRRHVVVAHAGRRLAFDRLHDYLLQDKSIVSVSV